MYEKTKKQNFIKLSCFDQCTIFPFKVLNIWSLFTFIYKTSSVNILPHFVFNRERKKVIVFENDMRVT